MKLTIQGRQIGIGDALRGHVEDRLRPITGKYFDSAIEGKVTVSREGNLVRAEIEVHAGRNIRLQAAGTDRDSYRAFDLAADKIAKRLRRYKSRLTSHGHRAEERVQAAAYYVLQGEPETVGEDHDEPDQPLIVAELETEVQRLSVSEAVMKMDLADAPARLFLNSVTGRFNMIYRRADGNIGWVDPSEAAAAD